MKIKTIRTNLFTTNTYIITDEITGKSAVVDPGENSDELISAIKEVGAENVEYILLTHGHFDHIYAVDAVKKLTNAKLAISQQDAEMLSEPYKNGCIMIGAAITCTAKPDILLNDGDEIELGELKIKVMLTPGHTKGSVCYLCKNAMFSGDTLFCGSYGRTDLYGGSENQISASLRKISTLPVDYDIYPGHDIKTTLSYEKEYNPKMR